MKGPARGVREVDEDMLFALYSRISFTSHPLREVEVRILIPRLPDLFQVDTSPASECITPMNRRIGAQVCRWRLQSEHDHSLTEGSCAFAGLILCSIDGSLNLTLLRPVLIMT